MAVWTRNKEKGNFSTLINTLREETQEGGCINMPESLPSIYRSWNLSVPNTKQPKPRKIRVWVDVKTDISMSKK